jgi:hypothetical protein
MKSTAEVVDGLRSEGYVLTRTYLAWLLRDRYLPPPQKFCESYAWTDADVDRLKGLLVRRGRGPGETTRCR